MVSSLQFLTTPSPPASSSITALASSHKCQLRCSFRKSAKLKSKQMSHSPLSPVPHSPRYSIRRFMDDTVAEILRDHADALCYKVTPTPPVCVFLLSSFHSDTGCGPKTSSSKSFFCGRRQSLRNPDFFCRICSTKHTPRPMPQPSHSGGVVGASTKQHQSGRCRGSGFLHASQSDGALLLKGFEFLIKFIDISYP